LEQLEDRITPTGPTLTALASFSGTNGANPYAGLIMDGSGNLYGTTTAGGASGDGTVFELAKGSSTIHTLASFSGTNGANPYAGLIMDGSGNLYGTTSAGGASGDGTVFELAKGSGTIHTLATFSGATGQQPYGGVIMDGIGNLYGTTWKGGTYNYGTVFELAKGSGTVATLASFNGNNGLHPGNSLTMDGSGNLYGTAQGGNAGGYGTIFELAKGSSTITTLASFNGTNGATPQGRLIMDGSGNLYGTTAGGGGNYGGEVFELAKGSGTITTLASFHGAPSTDGSVPKGGVIMDSSGNLYGTTEVGGASGEGTIFEVAKGSRTITWLASFNNTTGAFPTDGLLMDGSGNLYGTASGRGASGDGTVFELQGAIPDAAMFVGESVPTIMMAGQSYQVSLTMRNTGSATWTAGQLYRLGSQDPQDNTTWGLGRVGLPGPVAPGQQVTFNFTITAPSNPGTYNFQWRMVQDGVQWFGDFTPDVPVAVAAPSGAGTAIDAATIHPTTGAPLLPGQSFTALVATFSDFIGPPNNENTSINWGDGSHSGGQIVSLGNGNYQVLGTHTYSNPGTYTLTVQLWGNGLSSTVHSTAGVSTLTANQLFVEGLYEDFLGRYPDASGWAFWVSEIPILGRQGVANDIARSQEGLDHVVNQIYLAFLNRSADPGGQATYVSQLQSGKTEEWVMSQILGSQEFWQDCGGTNQGFVDTLYKDVLRRSPDAGGEAYWLHALNSGESRVQVASGFVNSAEFRSDAVQAMYGASGPGYSFQPFIPDLLERYQKSTPIAQWEINFWANSSLDLLSMEIDISSSTEFYDVARS
jgi:uncharacterized repeat protein (TIGR03803 family)